MLASAEPCGGTAFEVLLYRLVVECGYWLKTAREYDQWFDEFTRAEVTDEPIIDQIQVVIDDLDLGGASVDELANVIDAIRDETRGVLYEPSSEISVGGIRRQELETPSEVLNEGK